MKRIGLVLMAILIMASQGISQIINVPADQPSIQAGIDYATDGDTVLVADSIYYENINFNGKAITVASHFLVDRDTSHISKTIIDGSRPVHSDTASTVLMISGEDSTSVLCGFTVTGGTGTIIDIKYLPPSYAFVQTGGGILIIDGGCKIEHNIIRDIHMDFTIETYGGGIACYFASNERTDQKNIIIQNNSIMQNYLVSADHALGAGLYISVESKVSDYTGNIIIQDNIISHNNSSAAHVSMGSGIGIFMVLPTMNGEFSIRNNVITYNKNHNGTSNHGGGIYVVYWSSVADSNASPLIYNNIITENDSQRDGGGISVYAFDNLRKPEISPKPVVINNTLVNNSAPKGPGLRTNIKANPLLLNNIFWNNSSPNNTELSGMNSALIKYNNIRGYKDLADGSNLNCDPMLTGDFFELSESSPGIGNATDSIKISNEWYYAPSLEFFGNIRPHPIDNRVDMGAIESPYEGHVNIPDTALLCALIDEGVDTNEDSLISYAEAEAIISLNVSNRQIIDMTGLAAFINLDSLDCAKNEITDLNISSNTALTYLRCSSNNITSLDVSNNFALTELYCSGNQLTNLDVSGCTALTMLNCWDCQIKDLDISFCISLKCLDVRDNQLTSLDVSNNSTLNCMLCNNNFLTSLDLSNNAELIQEGICYLSGIDLSSMPSLFEVCVRNDFPKDKVVTTGSPNVCFTTDCGSCPTGILEYSYSEFTTYPNPTMNLLTIESDNSNHYSIEITSLNGQLLFNGEMNETTHQIDLSSFQKGVYFITIRLKDFVTTRKLGGCDKVI